MKILKLGRQFIKRSTEILQQRILDRTIPRTYLPPDITIKPQPLSDVFDGQLYLLELKRGESINEGRSAVVYNIIGHPDLVTRIEFGRKFKPEKLSYKNADPIRHIIAGTNDLSVTIMKKLKGFPLHGKHWHIMDDPVHYIYFPQLKALKSIPDEAFIKYYNDILELRKKGYNFDTKNPNNILYDSNKQIFNLVDIDPVKGIKPIVTIEDFYPFIDGVRLRHFYSKSSVETKKEIQKEVQIFLDRILKIGEEIGTNLSMRKVEDNDIIPPFLNCLYYNKKLDIYKMSKY